MLVLRFENEKKRQPTLDGFKLGKEGKILVDVSAIDVNASKFFN